MGGRDGRGKIIISRRILIQEQRTYQLYNYFCAATAKPYKPDIFTRSTQAALSASSSQFAGNFALSVSYKKYLRVLRSTYKIWEGALWSCITDRKNDVQNHNSISTFTSGFKQKFLAHDVKKMLCIPIVSKERCLSIQWFRLLLLPILADSLDFPPTAV